MSFRPGGGRGTEKLGLQVVIVDDNYNTVRLATYLFAEAGWTAIGFSSPHKALQRLSDLSPDIIITDFRMPEMNGPDFLLEAQEIHPTAAKLVMTSFDEGDDVQEFLRRAGVPVISKTKGLVEVIEEAKKEVAKRIPLKSASASASKLA